MSACAGAPTKKLFAAILRSLYEVHSLTPLSSHAFLALAFSNQVTNDHE
jgi:hypothetical protein